MKKNQKVSKLTEIVLSIFKEANSPQTVPQILSILKEKNLSPNKTTIYRQIQKLQEMGLLTAVTLNNEIAFFEFTTHHHHHLYCIKCTKISCLEDPQIEDHIHKLEKKVTKENWTVLQHEFSFSGICPNCKE